MEVDKIRELIKFFKSINIIEMDVTSDEERNSGQLVVIVTYEYNGKKYNTKRLYYRDIADLDEISHKEELIKHFGSPVYWLDIQKHDWPKGSGESDLNHIVIDDMIENADDEFRSFLLSLANNNKTGKIQEFTGEGRSNQYHHNLENNNHWHDLIDLIKAFIASKGEDIDEKYFARLIFNWDGNKNTKRVRSTLSSKAYWRNISIINRLKDNIKSGLKIMDKQNDNLVELLKNKKQIILQGAPGTGKTYTAKNIAKVLTENINEITEADILKYISANKEIKSSGGRKSYKIEEVDIKEKWLKIIRESETADLTTFKEIIEAYKSKKWDSKIEQNDIRRAASIAKYLYDQLNEEYFNNHCKLIQFHPAYTYEDFVRGIVVDTTSGSPDYKTINKPLAHFASEAYKNWIDSQKTPTVLSKERIFELQLEEFKKIVDEDIANKSWYKIDGTTAVITEVGDDSFRFTYEHDTRVNYTLLFSDLHKMNNSNKEFAIVKDVDEFELYMKRKASYYFRLYKSITAIPVDQSQTANIQVKEQNYVLIIDEINRANLPAVLGELIYGLEYRGEKVDSMYAIDGDHSLVLPPNLYIIGTMNTADRSVGLIDYAIRRRFAFVDMLPKVLPDELGFNTDLFKEVSTLFIKNIDDYIKDDQCKLIPSELLSDEFRPEDVWIGHSYFIMNDKDGKDISNIRIKYEIIPILKEYVKDGIFKDKTAAENKIDNLLSYL